MADRRVGPSQGDGLIGEPVRDHRVDEIREFWDADAATYDGSASHHPRSALELAAWSAALERLLPAAPAGVLDVGAGTGFLSLLAARLGHRVTALDVSVQMLERLREKAAAESLDIQTLEGAADAPPSGEFDAVIERHVVWTLPDPVAALDAWKAAAPQGRLLLFESAWGSAADPRESLLARVREKVQTAKNTPPAHHAPYPSELRESLPHGTGVSAERLVELVQSSAWGPARFERLRDVEWSIVQAMPGIERMLGAAPRFVVVAGP